MQYIWIIFTVLFTILAFYHFYQASEKIDKIKSKAKIKSINGVNLGVTEFVSEFNQHIDKQNRNNKKINIIQGFGYLLAALTALLSFFIS